VLSKDNNGAEAIAGNAVVAYAIIGFFVCGTFLMGGCAAGCTGGDGLFGVIILATLARVSVFIMACVCITILQQIESVSLANLDLLNEHVSVDCSDELSRVKTEPAIEGQNNSISSISKGVIYLAILIAFIGCECLCVICMAFSSAGCSCDCVRGDFGNWVDETKKEGALFFTLYKELN